ncbi:MAG: sulfotransferase domain-containing protein [Planctomycetota bacterium]|nr:sulfotransferase domain-containing protein [Planctomycetota bacterium]
MAGAMKGGTSSLFSYLGQHPQVLPASTKEVYYFDRQFARGPGWYRAHFPLKYTLWNRSRRRGMSTLTGEATPSYLSHPHAPRRAAELVPEAKILISLRNPVDRSYSQYQNMLREEREHLSFEEALEAEPERTRLRIEAIEQDPEHNDWHYMHQAYLARGHYEEQVARWLKHFPKESVLVLRSEDMFENAQGFYAHMLDFLGLQPRTKTDLAPQNTASYDPMPKHVRKRLIEYYEPHNRALYELVGRDFGWECQAAVDHHRAGHRTEARRPL